MLQEKNNSGSSSESAASSGRTPAEVRQLLNVIAGQIASEDFKTSASLEDIKVRLAQLQAQAQMAKAEAGGDLADEYERIEAALAELTTLVPGHVTDSALPPAALRSAVSGWVDNSRSTSGSRPDPFDIVDNGVLSPDTAAWTESEAEQLTRVYEEAEFKQALHAPQASPAPTSSKQMNFGAAPQTAEITSRSGITQPWLEDRFAEIADGLEGLLQETHPRVTIAALDDRISQLEKHLTSLLKDAGSSADGESLRQIEYHISDLALQLEKAQGQFGRIEGIESQLNAVVDHLAAQLEMAPQTPTQFAPGELQRLVEDAAEMTAQRYAAAQPLAAVGDGHTAGSDITGIKSMLEGYINERRQGDEHNSIMLDTVQQALIRVLDRIDSLETAHEKAVSQMTAKPNFGTAYGAGVASYEPSLPPEGMERRANPERRSPPVEAPVAIAPVHIPVVERPTIAVAAEPVAAAADQAPGRVGVDRLRQDFVADAQRGRQRASAMQAEAAPLAGSAAPMSAMRSRAAELELSNTDDDDIATEAKPSRMPSRKFLIAAAAMLALFAGLAAMKPSIPMPADEAATESTIEMTTSPDGAAAVAPAAGSPAVNAPVPAAKGTTQQIVPGGAPAAKTAPSPQSSLQFDNGDDAQASNGTANSSAAPTELPGIRLRAPDNEQSGADIALLSQQHRLAELSSKLGETAANSMTPAAFMQEVPLTKVPPTTTAAAGSSSALDLPPVTVGPLSMRLAAGKGDPSAEFEAGSRLAEGKGTAQDFKEAMRWYQRSASKGFAQAQYRLGTMYERGLGAKTDLGMARNWYQRAAEQGNIKAMHNLAVLSAGRQNGSPDYTTAAKWFGEAATRDLKDSQYNLGVLYENGLGVQKNMRQAAKWFSLAARSGDAESVRRRDLIKGQLSAKDQTALASDLANYKPTVEADPVINDARAAGEDWKKRAATATTTATTETQLEDAAPATAE